LRVALDVGGPREVEITPVRLAFRGERVLQVLVRLRSLQVPHERRLPFELFVSDLRGLEMRLDMNQELFSLKSRSKPGPWGMMVDRMPQVLVLGDDLMFVSRVREAARGLALEVQALRQPPAEAAVEARLALVDLDRFGDPETLAKLRRAVGDRPVVGFVSHVHAERARQAREAGITRVLARSAFVQELPS